MTDLKVNLILSPLLGKITKNNFDNFSLLKMRHWKGLVVASCSYILHNYLLATQCYNEKYC